MKSQHVYGGDGVCVCGHDSLSTGADSECPGRARVADWLQTYSGLKFYPLAPSAADIALVDIAHGLSQICRFGGQCNEFYSVAEHSIRVSQLLPTPFKAWGLLHDAAEAYVGDMIRPLKRDPSMIGYRNMEKEVERVIADRFGLVWPMPQEVKRADEILLFTECRDLCGGERAGKWGYVQMAPAEPLEAHIIPLDAKWAKHVFLETAERLGIE